jgi:hypothetical protein
MYQIIKEEASFIVLHPFSEAQAGKLRQHSEAISPTQ